MPQPAPVTAQLGFGMAAIGRPAYITSGRDADLPADRSPEALEARAHELLDAAAAAGVGYLDAARSYGRAEEFLAGWLRRSGAAPFVASKWGYRYTGGWRLDAEPHEVKEHTLAAFERQWAESGALLGPWLRLYQVHSLTVDSPLWADRDLLRALAGVRAEGTELGFSTSGPAQADAVRRGLALTVDGRPLFTSVQSTWNPLEPSAGEALAEAHAAGARVVVKEALANGRLAAADSPGTAGLGEAARARGVGVDVLALAVALAQPWADVVLSGAVTVGQLRAGATAMAVAADLAGTDVADLVTPQPAADYWAQRGDLPWR
ncbi:Predicted oxidoreductase [Geodermatophilus pulveris]|uniref:Predicted oxidoreductase n=1 Tax=Geodermatophilus pulveris TaxID=1564159 RepID=A0A239DVN4_9ACTN|nr:aldo/keto reductase [Geodermatophilus pulveris]SNS35783.1 Predicted oxidoreductase [Geodermatophilus pulveris]